MSGDILVSSGYQRRLSNTPCNESVRTGFLQFTGGGKVLVDPWLVGTLSFGEQTWLLESSKYLPPSVESVLEGVDAILLSQSLDDHTHIPTLKVLPKNIPIVAQPDAAEVARGLGFTDVRSLDHGEQVLTQLFKCFQLVCLRYLIAIFR